MSFFNLTKKLDGALPKIQISGPFSPQKCWGKSHDQNNMLENVITSATKIENKSANHSKFSEPDFRMLLHLFSLNLEAT
jgi:hypothetical protein